jgi:uncharacterized protein YndB with AHSA1/START domain/DNA-binding transcriptional ArsR family regulator
MDEVFRALADPHRRTILDRLHGNGALTLGQLCEGLAMTRQAVSKHLAVLEGAHLVTAVKRGRERLHHLNPAPIGEISDRWIGKYEKARVEALSDLKQALESRVPEIPMQASQSPSFRHVSYIRATPDAVWHALTDEAFARRYWFGYGVRSDWTKGSRFALVKEDGTPVTEGEVVEAQKPRRLVLTWRALVDEAMAKEPHSRVEMTIEPRGEVVQLVVEHAGFAPGSPTFESISGGWPAVLSSLKSILETGRPLETVSACAA